MTIRGTANQRALFRARGRLGPIGMSRHDYQLNL